MSGHVPSIWALLWGRHCAWWLSAASTTQGAPAAVVPMWQHCRWAALQGICFVQEAAVLAAARCFQQTVLAPSTLHAA